MWNIVTVGGKKVKSKRYMDEGKKSFSILSLLFGVRRYLVYNFSLLLILFQSFRRSPPNHLVTFHPAFYVQMRTSPTVVFFAMRVIHWFILVNILFAQS